MCCPYCRPITSTAIEIAYIEHTSKAEVARMLSEQCGAPVGALMGWSTPEEMRSFALRFQKLSGIENIRMWQQEEL